MTVADLIRELQDLPNQGVPVRVALDFSGSEEFSGPGWIDVDVDDVRSEGPFALIRTK